jgi:hypothetical protein
LAGASDALADPPVESIVQRVRRVLAEGKEPLSVHRLRQLCGLRTATVCAALAQLSAQGVVGHDPRGYQLKHPLDDPLLSLAHPLDPRGNGNGKHALCAACRSTRAALGSAHPTTLARCWSSAPRQCSRFTR